ncbi:transmembrane protein, putative [Medicago truncatula]|uniref:Transmembrane protein, putative n=1 Tax=Medicago truncatula TaxID=3880 RepID=G7KAI5_MEDTR|nr:transmembrane protein, putative [Medicago truncatula]
MTLASSTLQIRIQKYSGDKNIVIFVGLGILPFYAINVDVGSGFKLRIPHFSTLKCASSSH